MSEIRERAARAIEHEYVNGNWETWFDDAARAVIEELARAADAEEGRYYHEGKPAMQDHFAMTAKWLRSHRDAA